MVDAISGTGVEALRSIGDPVSGPGDLAALRGVPIVGLAPADVPMEGLAIGEVPGDAELAVPIGVPIRGLETGAFGCACSP